MKKMGFVMVASLALASCAVAPETKDRWHLYAEQQCAKLKEYGGPDYDHCVIDTVRQCESDYTKDGPRLGIFNTACKPN